MIRCFKNRRLKRLYERGDAFDVKRLRQIVARLDTADRPEEMDLPGLHFHELRGDRKGTYAVIVRANYRVTWHPGSDGAFIEVDYEDYH